MSPVTTGAASVIAFLLLAVQIAGGIAVLVPLRTCRHHLARLGELEELVRRQPPPAPGRFSGAGK